MLNIYPVDLIAQGTNLTRKNLKSILENEIERNKYKQISICVAYASFKGVSLIRGIFNKSTNVKFRWLIGLDDNFTDPRALTMIFDDKRSELRLAKLSPKSHFHPKVYLLSSGKNGKSTLIVGSCNISKPALTNGCEAFSVISVGMSAQKTVSKYWGALWRVGTKATIKRIDEYALEYKRTKRKYKPKELIDDIKEKLTQVQLDRTKVTSPLAWIELGKNTGGGGQLDVVKGLAPFLGLTENPKERTTNHLKLKSETRINRYQITFTKGMWRFMNLQQGFKNSLRPDLALPSPYVLVFERNRDSSCLEMRILPKTNPEMKRIQTNSQRYGFSGWSTEKRGSRKYGWI